MKTKIRETLHVYIPVRRLISCKKDIFLLPNKEYKLIIDYPLSKKAVFSIKTGKFGIGSNELMGRIGTFYEWIYQEDARTDGEKFGIWGHELSDLELGSIEINHKTKKIRLGIDS